jgi:hypothetical protein
VGLVLKAVNFFRIVVGLSRNGVSAVASGATQSDRVFAVFQFFKGVGGAVLVHRLDLSMARNTAFQKNRTGCRILLGRRRGLSRRADSQHEWRAKDCAQQKSCQA